MTAQIAAVATPTSPRSEEKAGQLRFLVAWFFCLLFYFLQYALRSAPGVMIPELIAAFGLTRRSSHTCGDAARVRRPLLCVVTGNQLVIRHLGQRARKSTRCPWMHHNPSH